MSTPIDRSGPAWAVAAFCGRGAVRLNNEDALSCDGVRPTDEELEVYELAGGSDHLLLVADGMGGHARGEIASALAVDCLVQAWRAARYAFQPLEALRVANRAVYDAMERDPALRGMGATVAGLHLVDDVYVWFNVGDSRVYAFCQGTLRQLSVDHVPQGATSANRHTRSHLVTQSIGGGYQHHDIWPAVGSGKIAADEILLVCSDGLTDAISERDIALALADGQNPRETVGGLVELAGQNGAPDNLSVLVVVPHRGT